MVNASHIMDALGQFTEILKKGPAMVARDWWVSIGHRPFPRCCCNHGLDGGQTDQADRTPTVFAGPSTGGLLSLSQGKKRAGWHHPQLQNVQEGVRGG